MRKEDRTTSLAIINETYLCLLPHRHDLYPSVPAIALKDIPTVLNACASLAIGKISLGPESPHHSIESSLPFVEIPHPQSNENSTITSDVVQYASVGESSIARAGSIRVELVEDSYKLFNLEDGANDTDGVHILNILYSRSSYVTADFCGMEDMEQILFLPPFMLEDDKETSTSSGMDLLRRFFRDIIFRSILTDGSYLLFHRTNSGSVFISMSCDDKHAAGKGIPYIRLSTADGLKTDIYSITSGEEKVEDDMGYNIWKRKLEMGIQKKIEQEYMTQIRTAKSRQVKKQIIQQSRVTLQRASLKHDQSLLKEVVDNTDLQLVRIRYGKHSSNEVAIDSTLGFSLHIEVDIAFGTKRKRQREDRNIGIDCKCEKINNVQLSASPVSNDESKVTVYTQSAVVPSLLSGDCVTIMAAVQLSKIRLHDSHQDDRIKLAINVLWSISDQRVSFKDGRVRKSKMVGKVVGSVQVPLESVLLHETQKKTISRLVEFNENVRPRFVPSALFDYRQPRTLILKGTTSESTKSNRNELTFMVQRLNEMCGIGDTIELYDRETEANDNTVKLSVYASSPTKRVGLVKLVLKYLSETSYEIVATTIMTTSKKYLVEEYAKAAKKELDLIEKHGSISPKKLRIQMIQEMAEAQSVTDELASTIASFQ